MLKFCYSIVFICFQILILRYFIMNCLPELDPLAIIEEESNEVEVDHEQLTVRKSVLK